MSDFQGFFIVKVSIIIDGGPGCPQQMRTWKRSESNLENFDSEATAIASLYRLGETF